MEKFNSIGIDGELDWKRIRKLLTIGLFAACIVLTGDMLLGYGKEDETLEGISRMLSPYVGMSDSRIFWSSLCGIVGIPLEGLSCFGIYRLIAPKSQSLAHSYRTGLFGYAIFGGCGVHMPCLASVFFYKYMLAADPENALEASIRFGKYFLLPGMVLFALFFFYASYVHIRAFASGSTPYPKWCWIFCTPVGMALTFLLDLFGESEIVNAITAGWISVGNIWMFAGLLLLMKSAEKSQN